MNNTQFVIVGLLSIVLMFAGMYYGTQKQLAPVKEYCTAQGYEEIGYNEELQKDYCYTITSEGEVKTNYATPERGNAWLIFILGFGAPIILIIFGVYRIIVGEATE